MVLNLALMVLRLARMVQSIASMMLWFAPMVLKLAPLVLRLGLMVQWLAPKVQRFALMVLRLARMVLKLALMVQWLAPMVQWLDPLAMSKNYKWESRLELIICIYLIQAVFIVKHVNKQIQYYGCSRILLLRTCSGAEQRIILYPPQYSPQKEWRRDGGADPSFTDCPMGIPPRRNSRQKLELDNLPNRTSSRDGGGGCWRRWRISFARNRAAERSTSSRRQGCLDGIVRENRF